MTPERATMREAVRPELLLSAEKCNQCLCTRNRIVSGQRAAQIIRECRRDNRHFVCHKADGEIVHCRGVHDILGGSIAYRLAKALGIMVRQVRM